MIDWQKGSVHYGLPCDPLSFLRSKRITLSDLSRRHHRPPLYNPCICHCFSISWAHREPPCECSLPHRREPLFPASLPAGDGEGPLPSAAKVTLVVHRSEQSLQSSKQWALYWLAPLRCWHPEKEG